MNNKGQALTIGVLFMTVLVAASALLLDTGGLFSQHADLQAVAEIAALSGISEKMLGTEAVKNAASAIIVDNLGSSSKISTEIEYPLLGKDYEKIRVRIAEASNTTFIGDNTSAGDDAVQSVGEAFASFAGDGSDWTEFQAGPDNIGSNEKTALTPPLKYLYEIKTKGNCRGQVAVNAGIAYGTAGQWLQAFDLNNAGALKWSLKLGQVRGITPTIKNDLIYIGTNYGDNTYYCITTAGAIKWQTTMKKIGTSTSLAVTNKYVFINSEADGCLYVLDASTGSIVIPNVVLPTYATRSAGFLGTGIPGPDTTGGYSKPAIYQNNLIYAGGLGKISAYDTETLTQNWHTSVGVAAGILDSPCIVSGSVYFGGTSYAYCLKASTGSLLWSKNLGDRCTTPAGNGNTVVLGSGIYLYALDASTGTELWHNGSAGYTTPAIAHGYVYAVNVHPKIGLQAFDLSSGKLIWQSEQKINSYFRDCGPAIAYGKVIVPDNNSSELVFGSVKSTMPRIIPPFTEDDYNDAMVSENLAQPKHPNGKHWRSKSIYDRYFTHLQQRYEAWQRLLGRDD